MAQRATIDGNEAAARVAYLASEVVAIYPITPASPMGEWADQWASECKANAWGTVPQVIEMQSEGGAAGAVHGALQAGSLATTFTASQGLLLMLPNMFKIAGELTPAVIHIAARSVATHALSIFCDHSDVMAARGTGFAMLFAGSVQEAHDMALIAHAATLKARVPFLHIFDGFRTSHEVATIDALDKDDVRALLDDEAIDAHRRRALSPDHPVVRGTAQNPDVFFQAREAINPRYDKAADIVQAAFDAFAARTGRRYDLYEYVGAPDAERVIVLMGSAAGAAREAVNRLVNAGKKVGLLNIRLYRPLHSARLLAALPPTVTRIAALDRTKEPGGPGEPLYLDLLAAVARAQADGSSPLTSMPNIVGGRYGLSSKEFTPAMVRSVLQGLATERPRHDFVIGIDDDVTGRGLGWDPAWSTESDDTLRAVFFGLGADGTVGANKNTIKIIGAETELHAQGYFVYDSKKSGSMTVSHLRFSPRPISATYLIDKASFVACHQFQFTERIDVLGRAMPGATFLLNSPHAPDDVWAALPKRMQRQLRELGITMYVIDAAKLAREVGMGRRINTIMQTCFFALSEVLPRADAIDAIRAATRKTYAKRGEAVVQKNLDAIDRTLDHLHKVTLPEPTTALSGFEIGARVAADAPGFVRDVTAMIMDANGDALPVSAMPDDGTFPVGTTRFEKRNVGDEIPVWDEDICVQCGKCVLVCPHATIRAKVFDTALCENAPVTFKTAKPRWKPFADMAYSLQVAPEDCTGCGLCVQVCPVKNKRQARLKAINMQPQAPLRDAERENWAFFDGLPDVDRGQLNLAKVKDNQLIQPLFEFSGACAGCGETPYLSLLSQLFGDRTVIANATGCSSIYGGNLPTTPWTTDRAGRGPAWSNSLFEDNAEFGLGMRVAIDKQQAYARELVSSLSAEIGYDLAAAILEGDQSTDAGVDTQRQRVVRLKERLSTLGGAEQPTAGEHAKRRYADLLAIADELVAKSVWIVGGDGWAYDIGFGGLDHVLASGLNVNILVLDTEVYSNTGGQMSKATPRAAVAKFAAGGKPTAKKDLGLMAAGYGNVYVARIAMGASDKQTIAAFREAESFPGTSLIIAYSHCIAHGYDMRHGMQQQDLAVKTGHWPLFRFDPRRAHQGKNPMQLDSRKPSLPLSRYVYNETRYTVLARARPKHAEALLAAAQTDVEERWQNHERLAAATNPKTDTGN